MVRVGGAGSGDGERRSSGLDYSHLVCRREPTAKRPRPRATATPPATPLGRRDRHRAPRPAGARPADPPRPRRPPDPPSTSTTTRSPASSWMASRADFGMVICPFDVIVAICRAMAVLLDGKEVRNVAAWCKAAPADPPLPLSRRAPPAPACRRAPPPGPVLSPAAVGGPRHGGRGPARPGRVGHARQRWRPWRAGSRR